jgi:hypothetical protein
MGDHSSTAASKEAAQNGSGRLTQHQLQELLEAIDLRSAKLVALAGTGGVGEAFDHGIGHIADIDRLEPGRAAADQGQHRRQLGQAREEIEELVLGPEHDARPHDGGCRKGLADRLLAGTLGARIFRFRGDLGADRGDLHEVLHAGRGGRLGDLPGAPQMYRLEVLLALLEQQADQVDGRIGAIEDGANRGRVL